MAGITKECSICGRQLGTIKCKTCGRMVCAGCIDKRLGVCIICAGIRKVKV
jgi:hypothetical protein